MADTKVVKFSDCERMDAVLLVRAYTNSVEHRLNSVERDPVTPPLFDDGPFGVDTSWFNSMLRDGTDLIYRGDVTPDMEIDFICTNLRFHNFQCRFNKKFGSLEPNGYQPTVDLHVPPPCEMILTKLKLWNVELARMQQHIDVVKLQQQQQQTDADDHHHRAISAWINNTLHDLELQTSTLEDDDFNNETCQYSCCSDNQWANQMLQRDGREYFIYVGCPLKQYRRISVLCNRIAKLQEIHGSSGRVKMYEYEYCTNPRPTIDAIVDNLKTWNPALDKIISSANKKKRTRTNYKSSNSLDDLTTAKKSKTN